MSRRLNLKCLLIVCVVSGCASAGPIYATATNDLEATNRFNLTTVNPANGDLTTLANLTTVGALFTGCFAHIASESAVLTTGFSGSSSLLSLVSVNAHEVGTTLGQFNWDGFLSSNVQFDTSSHKTWVTGFDASKQLNTIYELNVTTWALDPAVELKWNDANNTPMVVELGRSTFCPVGHVIFLTVRDDSADSGQALVRVDVNQRKLLSVVPLSDYVQMMMWDDRTATLYAWSAPDVPNQFEKTGAVLATVDPSTGARLRTIANFSADKLSASAFGGANSILDAGSNSICASLVNQSDSSSETGVPTFVAVELGSGNATFGTASGAVLIGLSR